MYHKVKNTLAGLAMSAAFMLGGMLLSEPVPAEMARPAAAAETQEAALAQAVLLAAVSLATNADSRPATQTVADEAAARARTKSRLRLELGMPYYSFGAMLPRRGES